VLDELHPMKQIEDILIMSKYSDIKEKKKLLLNHEEL